MFIPTLPELVIRKVRIKIPVIHDHFTVNIN
jgi:hypothetical protein